MKSFKLLFILVFCISCSENLFDEIADKDTNEAKYFQAKQEINQRQFSTAISTLLTIDANFLADRERVPVHASAYAGFCGLDFLTLLNNMQNSGSGTVFTTLMTAFPGAVEASALACVEAETIMENIGDESARDANENLFMAFNGLAKIGAILSFLADQDNDGVADATFDQCDAGDFPEPWVRELGASIAVTILSLTAVGTSYVDDALADVNALCALDAQLAVFCTATDPSAFTAPQIQAMRYAIGSTNFGINSCGNQDFTNCAIANPVCP